MVKAWVNVFAEAYFELEAPGNWADMTEEQRESWFLDVAQRSGVPVKFRTDMDVDREMYEYQHLSIEETLIPDL